MIYITGDTHSDFSRFTKENFPIQSEMTKDDYVIICGDFGGVWTFEEESSREKEALDWLNNKNFKTLFVDGNHENYTRLYNYPVEEWHCGKVHKIRNSVLHLMRGEIFNINNKKIFTFGGAKSHDIQDGILNLDEEEKISNIINNELELIGVTSKLKGREYIHDAILYLVQDDSNKINVIQYLVKKYIFCNNYILQGFKFVEQYSAI